jgi:capsular polysaccharide biosynthesis protein
MTNVQRATTTVMDGFDTIGRHRLIVIATFVVSLGIAIALLNRIPHQFVAGANVLVVNGNTRDDPTLSSQDLPSIAMSTVVLDRVAQKLQLDLPLLTIKRHLTVTPPPYKSSIIRIEYTDSQAARAAMVANGVADELTQYYGQVSTARYNSDLQALDSELSRQTDRIDTIARQIQARGGIATAPTATADRAVESDSPADRLSSLQTERELSKAALQGDIASAQALDIDAQTRAKVLRRDVLGNDVRYHDLLSAVSSSSLALANQRAVFTSRYPGLPALETKVGSLNVALEREAQRALNSPDAYSPAVAASITEQRKASALITADQAKVAALDGLIANERAHLAAQAPLEVLRLQLDAARADYLAISSRRAAALANRADALSLGSVSVVDRAIASEVQIGMSRKALLTVSLAIVLALSFGSAFLAELFDPRLRRAAQIENLYGQQVIATIGR